MCLISPEPLGLALVQYHDLLASWTSYHPYVIAHKLYHMLVSVLLLLAFAIIPFPPALLRLTFEQLLHDALMPDQLVILHAHPGGAEQQVSNGDGQGRSQFSYHVRTLTLNGVMMAHIYHDDELDKYHECHHRQSLSLYAHASESSVPEYKHDQ